MSAAPRRGVRGVAASPTRSAGQPSRRLPGALLRAAALACACASAFAAQSAPGAGAAAGAPDLTRERALLAAGDAARESSDYAAARAKAAEAVDALLARPEGERDAAWQQLLSSAGDSAYLAGDPHTAHAAWRRVLEIRSRTLPADDLELQRMRGNVAVTLRELGDLHGALAMEEQVLEVLSRTLPEDHRDLQGARQNLAVTLSALGDLRGAATLLEQVLEVLSRTLPDDHPSLQAVRGNLAGTIRSLGDLEGARALQEQVLEVCERTLPEEHLHLQAARSNLASTLYLLGDLSGARALEEEVLAVFSRTLPDDHRNVQLARQNLAGTIKALGDLAGARALEEQVLEVLSRTLPDDHPDLQDARGNLAGTLYLLGDLAGAEALQRKALAVASRTLPEDHPDLQFARQGLGRTLGTLGDTEGARALFEQVLAVQSRTLPADHPDLQAARGNLAGTLLASGEHGSARALREEALEVLARTLPDEHRDVQAARVNLAETIAVQLAYAGRAGSAGERSAPEREAAGARCRGLIGALCRAQVRAAREAIVASPGREAEERCASLAWGLDVSLSFAEGYGVLEPSSELGAESFVLAETMRGAALVSARLVRRAARSPRYAELREALGEASDALALLARTGATSDELDRARAERESIERELVALAREAGGGGREGTELDVESLAARLAEREAAVSFRRFTKTTLGLVDRPGAAGGPAVRASSVESLCAFVVRSAKDREESDPPSAPVVVDLGPLAPVESAARAWRDAIGVGLERGMAARGAELDRARERGDELRARVLDPLLPALGSAERLTVVLDDVLHLVPLEALPLAEPEELVGDRWRIETRATLTELLTDPTPPGAGALVALGDASFNVPSLALSSEEAASIEAGAPVAEAKPVAAVLRGTAWERGFTPLTYTAEEARGIGALYRELFEDERPVIVLERRKASRAALEELAPRARFLHIATHGWFAPESIRSWSDPGPLDEKSGLGMRVSGVEQVKGMSPMLLCGLALAGANLPEDEVGRAPGLITAEEIAALDLSHCELAVLSACDTNVGERRAGQGVASLQKALQMAGARSVITSLWKVPDEATKELMLDFYRRLWVEGKPKHQALWEAKTRLRKAEDERGAPEHTPRDWAAWVLTGDPD